MGEKDDVFLKGLIERFIDAGKEQAKANDDFRKEIIGLRSDIKMILQEVRDRPCILQSAENAIERVVEFEKSKKENCKTCLVNKLSVWMNLLILMAIVLAIGKEIAWPVLSKLFKL